MSAYLRAGASLTPSPVIATIWFCFFNNYTSNLLCFGSVLEKTSPSVPDNAF